MAVGTLWEALRDRRPHGLPGDRATRKPFLPHPTFLRARRGSEDVCLTDRLSLRCFLSCTRGWKNRIGGFISLLLLLETQSFCVVLAGLEAQRDPPVFPKWD